MELIGYFSKLKRAKETVDKLKDKGFNAHVDMNDHYIEDRNVRTNLPGTETSVSLSGLILESDSHTTAMKNSLGWMDEQKVSTKRIGVLAGNDVLKFYEKYGFKVRTYILHQIDK